MEIYLKKLPTTSCDNCLLFTKASSKVIQISLNIYLVTISFGLLFKSLKIL